MSARHSSKPHKSRSFIPAWMGRKGARPGGEEQHDEHEAHCMALCCAQRGQCACVTQLVGDAGDAERLRDLGVREGARVTILRDGDPLMVKVGAARFGIGRAAAMNVLCSLVETQDG